MPQSLSQVYLHLVFSTKHRQPFLKDAALRKQMHAYLAGACKNLGSPSLIVGGVEDHVHILCRQSANQEEHHKKETFQEELRRLCKKYALEIDERYVWD